MEALTIDANDTVSLSAFGSELRLVRVDLLAARLEGSEKSPHLVSRPHNVDPGGASRVLLIIASDGLLDMWCPITGFDSTRYIL